jgi:hypothetical protein
MWPTTSINRRLTYVNSISPLSSIGVDEQTLVCVEIDREDDGGGGGTRL